MKKFLSVLVLISALIVGGCGGSSFGIYLPHDTDTSAENKIIKVLAENEEDAGGSNSLTIPEGSCIQVNANISSGKLIIIVEDKEYEINKTGESFIDVSAGEQKVDLLARDGLTGEIILRAVPKD